MKVHQTTEWSAAQVRQIALSREHLAPLILETSFAKVLPDLDLWDAWPVQDRNGWPVDFAGTTLWMALAAPRAADPDERHGKARIHLLQEEKERWTYLGPALPDGFSPGSREWAGSAIADPGQEGLTLYFTATGERGEPELSFVQRLFAARASIRMSGNGPRLHNWHSLQEIVTLDPAWYMRSDDGSGTIGTIKAFRDPGYFHDPASGDDFLFFTGSAARSHSKFNGVVGAIGRRGGAGEWQLQPPLISAEGLNNELERPHVITHNGRYYLFWSTQTHVFDPSGPQGPTGLYGMVAERLNGTWGALNGTGLVFANPPQAPAQAYSWLVLPDLTVVSFVDNWGQPADAVPRRFGGTFAPRLQLRLNGCNAQLAL